MPAVVKVMKTNSTLVTLIKPQFEARRSQVGKGGIVRDPLVHKEVLDRIISGIEKFGFRNEGWIESPLKGAEGNIEFLACFHRIPMSEAEADAEGEVEVVEAEGEVEVVEAEGEAQAQADAEGEVEMVEAEGEAQADADADVEVEVVEPEGEAQAEAEVVAQADGQAVPDLVRE